MECACENLEPMSEPLMFFHKKKKKKEEEERRGRRKKEEFRGVVEEFKAGRRRFRGVQKVS